MYEGIRMKYYTIDEYKELRDDGIIWLDAKRENIGRLEKDNIAHFKEPIYVKNIKKIKNI